MVSIHDMFTLGVFWKGHERSSKSLILVVTLAGAKYSHNSYIDIRLGQGKTIVTSNLFRHGWFKYFRKGQTEKVSLLQRTTTVTIGFLSPLNVHGTSRSIIDPNSVIFWLQFCTRRILFFKELSCSTCMCNYVHSLCTHIFFDIGVQNEFFPRSALAGITMK
jgi:hypothetical protein